MACGPSTSTVPVDTRFIATQENTMGELLRKYNVKVNGHDTVLNLTEEDAKKLYPDATPAQEEQEPQRASKTRMAPNKARTAENK